MVVVTSLNSPDRAENSGARRQKKIAMVIVGVGIWM
jgi:hypothetical protein